MRLYKGGKADGEPEQLDRSARPRETTRTTALVGLRSIPANPEWLAFGFGENLGADYAFVGY